MPRSAIEGRRRLDFTCARDHHLGRRTFVSDMVPNNYGKKQDDGQPSSRPSSWSGPSSWAGGYKRETVPSTVPYGVTTTENLRAARKFKLAEEAKKVGILTRLPPNPDVEAAYRAAYRDVQESFSKGRKPLGATARGQFFLRCHCRDYTIGAATR
jgi:hypothetical protein